jgi:hypothetical protein
MGASRAGNELCRNVTALGPGAGMQDRGDASREWMIGTACAAKSGVMIRIPFHAICQVRYCNSMTALTLTLRVLVPAWTAGGATEASCMDAAARIIGLGTGAKPP